MKRERAVGVWAGLGLMAMSALAGDDFRIVGFGNNGEISWQDPGGSGTQYAVQWAPTANGPWMSWVDAQTNLSGLGSEGTAAIPMFYRMVNPDPTYDATRRYTYFEKMPPLDPRTPLATNEMRITFMGSVVPPSRRAQAEMSVFVEVGWVPDPADKAYGGRAKDQFVFDCGAGVTANYTAMNVGYRRMDKVFINHLHGDHMTDLVHIYCFGPSGDRKSPLFVFGPSKSNVESPAGSGIFYDDGVSNYCATLRQAMRWHTESFSFEPTSYTNYIRPTKESWGLPVDPVPVGNDSDDDSYAMIPIEFDWTKHGEVPGDNVAYHNTNTGVKVTYFPVIHCRQGSVGYKVEWNGLSMIYTSDTKPETNCIDQAHNKGNGVDVFVHEMAVPPSVWAYKSMGLDAPPATTSVLYATYLEAVDATSAIQDSSHTTQGAFGYIMSQLNPRPRLTVATHFPTADDTVASALDSVKQHVSDAAMGTNIVWSFDCMILRVFPDRIEQARGDISRFAFSPFTQMPSEPLNPPKYHTPSGDWDPYAQISTNSAIPATNPDGSVNYSEDGF